MKKFILILATFLTTVGSLASAGEQLKSGEYVITQSWSQEKAFERLYVVSVPEHADQQKLPVFIFLHGNGGNAKGAMSGFMTRRRTMAAKFVMVFANGYQRSWNIVSERSKADDRGFLEAIVKKLATCDNVQPDNFSVMGASNGAALVNQLAIESKLPNIRNYISGVSPLNVFQYDGKNFKTKGDDNKAALDTIDGEEDGMDADSPLLAGASKKSLFVTNALDVPGDYQKTTKCPVLRKCTAAFANLTEKKGKITAKYVFAVESEKTASGFKRMVDAGLAMGRSRAGDGEAVGKVLDGIETKVKGEVLTLTLKTTTDDIQAAVKQMMAGWRR